MTQTISNFQNTTKLLKNIDWVALLPLFILAGIAMVSLDQAIASVEFALQSLWSTGIFLLISVLFAAYAKASSADQLVSKAFSGRVVVMIFVSTLFAAFSPFCSCGVIPFIAALLAAGVPLAAVMAFWIASPLMSPEHFILTSSMIGVDFALLRVGTAVTMGLFAGFVTLGIQKFNWFKSPLKSQGCSSSCSSEPSAEPRVNWKFWQEAPRQAEFKNTFLSTGTLLLKWLTIAFVLESLMVAYVPTDVITNWLGTESVLGIFAAVIVGVPTYLNGFAAIPLIDGLMDKGMSTANALAFLTAGSVSSVPAAMAVFALVKKSVFAWYLSVALIGSILVGLAALLVS